MSIKVNSKTFNELLRVSRKYWSTGDTDILDKKINLSNELEKQTKAPNTIFIEIVNVMARLDIDTETCGKILALLNIELVNDEQLS